MLLLLFVAVSDFGVLVMMMMMDVVLVRLRGRPEAANARGVHLSTPEESMFCVCYWVKFFELPAD